jgi:hypothetical protein
LGKNAPAKPDYAGAAQQQAQSSQQNVAQQTTANRANQNNAFGGSSQWSQDPNTGQWTQNAALGGALVGAAGTLEGQVAQNAGTPIGTGDQARQQAISGIFGSEMGQLNPQFQLQNEQNATQLANEGLSPGSAAARAQNNQVQQGQNQAELGALGQATEQGTAAQQATFNENLQAHNNPLSQLQGLQGFAGQSGYNQAGQADPLQALQASQAQFGANTQLANQQNQQMGQLGQAGGQVAQMLPYLLSALSDERLKRDIIREPAEAYPGVPWATWAWRHPASKAHLGRFRGVIAQDVQRVAPHLVNVRPDGFLEVRYAEMMGVANG